MGIKELEEHLNKSGNKEIEAIRKERDETLKSLEKEYKETADKEVKQILLEGEKEAEAVKQRVLAKAKIKAKEMIESERIRIVEEVLEKAKEAVIKSSDSKKKALMEVFSKEATSEVENPEVFADKKYASLINAKIQEIGDFGVVVEDKSSGVVINNTLFAKIERQRDEVIPKAVEVLF